MKDIMLRPIFDEDIVSFKKWLYMPHVLKWYHNPQDWLDEVEKRNNEFSFLHHFIVEVDGVAIGFCQYYEYCQGGETWLDKKYINGTYSIDYLIGDTAFLHKGYGKKIVTLLIEKILLISKAKYIIVQPEKENKASCNTLLSCGFTFNYTIDAYLYEL